jgi:demethylmenaquinone methyltransferase/2-methoxy-6-polyprenyl-1,4-benzoquinol methylase
MKSQKDFFNSVADSWDCMCKHDMTKVESILDLAEIKPGSHILDVGTGTGILVPSLAKRITQSGRIKAVDVAEKMIEVARKKNSYEHVVFECEDALDCEENQTSYDHVICYSMFPHFQDKEEAIGKLARKIKNGGKLVICHSQSRDAINKLHKRVDEAVKEDNLPSMVTLEQLFESAGLSVRQTVDDLEMFVIIGERQ